MNRPTQLAIGALAVIGAVFVLLQVGASLAAKCTGRTISSAVSPDGSRIAEYWQTSCKPDYVPVAELTIREGSSNVSIQLGPATTTNLVMSWRDNSRLVVGVPPSMGDVFDRLVAGVDVEFQIIGASATMAPNKTMEPSR